MCLGTIFFVFSLGMFYFHLPCARKTHAELDKVVIYQCGGKCDPGAFVN